MELVSSARRSFTRLTRFINRLMREQMACGPVTVQQYYALEALSEQTLSMNALAAEVALHQSTLTRVVGKLEAQGLVRRARPPGDQRTVMVELTPAGRSTYKMLDRECSKLIEGVLALVPEADRATVVRSLATVSAILEPTNESFRELLAGCCSPGAKGDVA